MDRSAALELVPDRYAYALRMRGEGIADDAIARILAIDPDAVSSLMAIADAKVTEILDDVTAPYPSPSRPHPETSPPAS